MSSIQQATPRSLSVNILYEYLTNILKHADVETNATTSVLYIIGCMNAIIESNGQKGWTNKVMNMQGTPFFTEETGTAFEKATQPFVDFVLQFVQPIKNQYFQSGGEEEKQLSSITMKYFEDLQDIMSDFTRKYGIIKWDGQADIQIGAIPVPIRTLVTLAYVAIDTVRVMIASAPVDSPTLRIILSVIAAFIDIFKGNWHDVIPSLAGIYSQHAIIIGVFVKLMLYIFKLNELSPIVSSLVSMSRSIVIRTCIDIFKTVAPLPIRQAIDTSLASMNIEVDGVMLTFNNLEDITKKIDTILCHRDVKNVFEQVQQQIMNNPDLQGNMAVNIIVKGILLLLKCTDGSAGSADPGGGPFAGLAGLTGGPTKSLSGLAGPLAGLTGDPTKTLSGLTGDPTKSLAGLAGPLAGLTGDPTKTLSGLTGDPTKSLAGLAGDPTKSLAGLTGDPTKSLAGLTGDPTKSLAGLTGLAGDPTKSLSGLAGDPTKSLAGLAGDPTKSLAGLAGDPTKSLAGLTGLAGDPTKSLAGLAGDPTKSLAGLAGLAGDPTKSLSGLAGLAGDPTKSLSGLAGDPTKSLSGLAGLTGDPTKSLAGLTGDPTKSLSGLAGLTGDPTKSLSGLAGLAGDPTKSLAGLAGSKKSLAGLTGLSGDPTKL